MIPVGWMTRLSEPPHTGQAFGPSSVMEWTTSVIVPHERHW
jgi:hypothetical protein